VVIWVLIAIGVIGLAFFAGARLATGGKK